jgi:hypothetical protein
MKQIDIKTLITDERAAQLRADPEVVRLKELGEKVRAGTASDEETAEYDEMTASARAIDPSALTD